MDVQENARHCRAKALRQRVLGVFQKQGGERCVDTMAERRAVRHKPLRVCIYMSVQNKPWEKRVAGGRGWMETSCILLVYIFNFAP